MNRRETILALIVLGTASLSGGPLAQQNGKIWRIGWLLPRSAAEGDADYFAAFPQGLRDLGYIEGKNLVIERRFAEFKQERFPALAAELVQLNVDVLVASGTQATAAAQKATATIPIVMTNTTDPVASGFVKTLAHPGGNITGRSTFTGDLRPKQLEFLLSAVPKATRVAALFNPTMLNPTLLNSLQEAAKNAGVRIIPVEARFKHEIDNAFASMAQQKVEAVVVVNDALFDGSPRQIADLAAKYHLPLIGSNRTYTEAGCLMNYGPNYTENYRRSAYYVDRILKGTKPADLPVEQPMVFEFLINQKTARALGVKIPKTTLLTATAVIE
jgi:putative ABC transport system substrate-binding protein